MDKTTIDQLWKKHEAALEASTKLNLGILKEIRLEKAKSALKKLRYLPVSTLVFFLLIQSYGLYFAVLHWGVWYSALSGMVLGLFSFLLVLSSIRQLKLILEIDYGASVLKLQKDLSNVKMAVVDNLGIGVWMLPFFPAFLTIVFQALFGVDLWASLPYEMFYVYACITALLLLAAIGMTRALRARNLHKKWLIWWLQGSGSQVDEALGFLRQIREFEEKPSEGALYR